MDHSGASQMPMPMCKMHMYARSHLASVGDMATDIPYYHSEGCGTGKQLTPGEKHMAIA